MNIFRTILSTIIVTSIGYGWAQKFEGSPCTMHDGRTGTCKNVDRCESIKQGLRHGQLRYMDIVGCSFMGTVQIACCADETSEPIESENHQMPPSTTDFVFFNDFDSTTTNRRPSEQNSIDPFANRYGHGRKAEAACELYSALVPDVGISWKILGGISAALGEFPWMAAISYSNDDSTFDCGGTIISDYYILTAAHCTPTRRPPVKVRLGKVTLLTNDDDAIPVDLKIQEIIRHPDYKASTKKNDIALIRVAERIEFTDNIRPACLQTNVHDVLPNTELFVTGWGSTSAERTLRPAVLLKTNVTSMPLSACNATLSEYNRQVNHPSLRSGISDSQFCAYDPKARNDACQGDSGGPLQTFSSPAIGTVVGVVSFGISCGTSLPGVYTRVAHFCDWIESIVWPNALKDIN